MTQIARSVSVDAPIGQVWSTVSEFGSVYLYSPHVARSLSTSAATRGVGATRRCELTMKGASMDERIVAWSEGESLAFEVFASEKAPPFKTARVQLALRADGPATLATATLDYTMRHGPAGALLDRLVVSPQFGKVFGSMLAGLKHHVETGELVDELTELDLDAVMPTRPEAAPTRNRTE